MSIGMTTDFLTFAQTAWLWEVVFEEMTVEELEDATRCSLLEIVSDTLSDVLSEVLDGGRDELLALAEAQTVAETAVETPAQSAFAPSPSWVGLAGEPAFTAQQIGRAHV